MALYNYACHQVTVTIDASTIGLGVHTVEGFQEGSMVRVNRGTPINSLRNSADARVNTRSHRKNKNGTYTITLEEGSPSCAFLDDCLKRDEEEGDAIFSILVKDNSGNERAHSAQAWLVNYPDIDKAAEAGTREFVIESDVISPDVRGSTLA